MSKCHDAILFGASHGTNATVATIPLDISIESCPRQEIHYLGEKRLASIHGILREKSRNFARIADGLNSNRHHPLSLANLRQLWLAAFRGVI
jgi:hypothetical protein